MFTRDGQGSLALVLFIGIIVGAIVLGLGVIILSFLNSSFGYQANLRAEAAAEAGANDAIMRLVRNVNFASAGYTVQAGSDSATVTVAANTPQVGYTQIVSKSTVLLYTRTFQVNVSISTSSGLVAPASWTQL